MNGLGAGLAALAIAGFFPVGSAAGRETAGRTADTRAAREPGLVAFQYCNPSKVAEDFWFTNTDPGTVSLWFNTVEEAENYADPLGRHVYWLVRVARTLKTDSFVGGINDLWAVEFYVNRGSQCELVVTAEH